MRERRETDTQRGGQTYRDAESEWGSDAVKR